MAGNDGQAVGEGMVDSKPDIAWDDDRIAHPEYSAQRTGVVHLPRKMAPGCAACQRPQLRFLRPAADNEDLDQRAMLREFVKWDYELPNGETMETAVDRALNIAMTEPRGAVYMTLPRETLRLDSELSNAVCEMKFCFRSF